MDPNNDIDWTNRSGGTPSPQTGPFPAYDGSYYMYTEASGNGMVILIKKQLCMFSVLIQLNGLNLG